MAKKGSGNAGARTFCHGWNTDQTPNREIGVRVFCRVPSVAISYLRVTVDLIAARACGGDVFRAS
jgi:hypothetical protein